MIDDSSYMHRCIELALLGSGSVAPNPMVGAVLVYRDRIIGEGYHMKYGGPHAEVNCIESVKQEDEPFIQQATLYVTLEPCAHFGKTPPCADLIIKKNISKVVIGCRDPFPEVAGKGIEKLVAAGIEVYVGVLENKCRKINKRFFTFHQLHRPYITLKWAQTANGKIAASDYSRVLISNEYTNRMVHKWRGEEMAIMIGTNTAFYDNPELTIRLFPGTQPIRLILDLNLRLPTHLKIFSSGTTVIFNFYKHTLPIDKITLDDLRCLEVVYYQLAEGRSVIHQILNALYFMKVYSVLVEGGSRLLQSFIDENAWDECRIIEGENKTIEDGLAAPQLKNEYLVKKKQVFSDAIYFFAHQ